MCTAISFCCKDHYFGRNLDYEYDFGEKVTITPRNFVFRFVNGSIISKHYAIIGMAMPMDGYPLYFDATNEAGLSVAGLNFPDNAYYNKAVADKSNVASFEFIPWVLSQCSSVDEAVKLMSDLNITDNSFKRQIKPSPLHWIVADKKRTVTVEQTKAGLKIYNNEVGVLTNNPPFDVQMFNLNNYMSLSPCDPINSFSENIDLKTYSRGMGTIGLPGDYSSASRFVRAVYVKLNSVCDYEEKFAVPQFFHILYSVYQHRGCVKVGNAYEITNYTSCCNTDKCIYYYTTYNNPNIVAVNLFDQNLFSTQLMEYDLKIGKTFA